MLFRRKLRERSLSGDSMHDYQMLLESALCDLGVGNSKPCSSCTRAGIASPASMMSSHGQSPLCGVQPKGRLKCSFQVVAPCRISPSIERFSESLLSTVRCSTPGMRRPARVALAARFNCCSCAEIANAVNAHKPAKNNSRTLRVSWDERKKRNRHAIPAAPEITATFIKYEFSPNRRRWRICSFKVKSCFLIM